MQTTRFRLPSGGGGIVSQKQLDVGPAADDGAGSIPPAAADGPGAEVEDGLGAGAADAEMVGASLEEGRGLGSGAPCDPWPVV